MARKISMVAVIMVLTAALLEGGIGSCHGSISPHDPLQDQRDNEQETTKVEITIQKPVEPEPAPRPAPSRRKQPKIVEPPSPPPLVGRTFVPSALDYLKGDRLLEGGFPRLSATYERLGFPAYRDAVRALGGDFFLWDGGTNQPIARVDVRTGEVSEALVAPQLSRWPRDVTKHVKAALARGKAEFGERVTHIVLLPPSRLDAAMLSGLDHLLQQNGIGPDLVSGFFIAFEMQGKRLHCTVLSASFKDGSERSVSYAIDLGGAFL